MTLTMHICRVWYNDFATKNDDNWFFSALLGDFVFILSQNTVHHNAGHWSDYNEYNLVGGETGFDSQETKLPTYWKTSFSKICFGMKIGQKFNFIIVNKQADSLYSLIADGQYRATSLGRDATSLGRDTWKKLIGSQASLQPNCNKEGFNVFFVFIITNLKQESVCLVTTKTIVKARIRESGLVLEVLLLTTIRVETKTSEPWDTFWSSEK